MPKSEHPELLTTAQVGEQLGIGKRRVVALISSGRLPAVRYGQNYLIKPSDLDLVRDRPPGRPPKRYGTPLKRYDSISD